MNLTQNSEFNATAPLAAQDYLSKVILSNYHTFTSFFLKKSIRPRFIF